MKYRELIHKIQHDAGFSDAESEDALDMMVETIAERLNEGERKDFASQLPAELQAIALYAEPGEKEEIHAGIIEEFMAREEIPEDRAKKQVMSAWGALKAFISEGEIRHIKSQLSEHVASVLY